MIASYQGGVKNVIASSGTALTLEQLKLLGRYTKNIALAFDADLAGQTAAERGIETALSLGMNVKIITLPKEINGCQIKDPDDCIKQGVNYWQEAIKNAQHLMDFYFLKNLSNLDLNDSIAKKQVAAKLLKQIAKLIDKIEQDHWLVKLAEKLNVPDSILRETFDQYLNQSKKPASEIDSNKSQKKQREYLLAEQLLALILKYPQNIEYALNHLEKEMIPQMQLQKIYTELILYYNKSKQIDFTQFEKLLLKEGGELVNIFNTLMLLADKDFLNFTEEKIKTEIIYFIKELKKHLLSQKLKQIQQLMLEAEKNNEQKQLEDLSNEFLVLTNQLQNI